jgi:hypothetical protein
MIPAPSNGEVCEYPIKPRSKVNENKACGAKVKPLAISWIQLKLRILDLEEKELEFHEHLLP